MTCNDCASTFQSTHIIFGQVNLEPHKEGASGKHSNQFNQVEQCITTVIEENVKITKIYQEAE